MAPLQRGARRGRVGLVQPEDAVLVCRSGLAKVEVAMRFVAVDALSRHRFTVSAMSLALVADADLVARCRRGDQEAWNELVNRFSRYVYAITTRIYRLEQHDAEDVFQEVFARTYERLDELRDDAAVRPWIGTLTRRLCVDKLRARRPRAADRGGDRRSPRTARTRSRSSTRRSRCTRR